MSLPGETGDLAIGATDTGTLTSVAGPEVLGAITAPCPGLVDSSGHSGTGL